MQDWSMTINAGVTNNDLVCSVVVGGPFQNGFLLVLSKFTYCEHGAAISLLDGPGWTAPK
jgi:hypothetical protein